MKNDRRELILHGSIYKAIFVISIPIILNFFIQQLKYSMFVDLLRLWGIRIPLLFFFKYFTAYKATGIWLAMAISNVLVTFIAHFIYAKGDWKGGSF